MLDPTILTAALAAALLATGAVVDTLLDAFPPRRLARASFCSFVRRLNAGGHNLIEASMYGVTLYLAWMAARYPADDRLPWLACGLGALSLHLFVLWNVKTAAQTRFEPKG